MSKEPIKGGFAWEEVAFPAPGGTLIRIRLNPKSSSNAVCGVSNSRLVVNVSTPPVEGRANKAMVRLLAKTLGVPPSTLEIVKGGHSREKVILVKDWSP